MSLILLITLDRMRQINKKNIFWGVLVVTIWGIIIIRVHRFYSTEPCIPLSETEDLPESCVKIKREHFSIEANYTDPFLKEIAINNSNDQLNTDIVDDNNYTIENTIWPNIELNGIFMVSEGKKCLALINVEGKQYLVQPTDSVNGMLVKTISSSCIQFSFCGSNKVLEINR